MSRGATLQCCKARLAGKSDEFNLGVTYSKNELLGDD